MPACAGQPPGSGDALDREAPTRTRRGPLEHLLISVGVAEGGDRLVDHTSPMGTLKLALEEADQRRWTVVSMKDDWKEIFASG